MANYTNNNNNEKNALSQQASLVWFIQHRLFGVQCSRNAKSGFCFSFSPQPLRLEAAIGGPNLLWFFFVDVLVFSLKMSKLSSIKWVHMYVCMWIRVRLFQFVCLLLFIFRFLSFICIRISCTAARRCRRQSSRNVVFIPCNHNRCKHT